MSERIHVPVDALRAELARKLQPKYATPLFQLRDIPAVMRSRLGWTVAAALMERWFNGAPFQLTPQIKGSVQGYKLSQLSASQLDERTVTMGWALGYARVQTALAKLRANWASPAGVLLLKQRVELQSGIYRQQCWRFGQLGQPAKMLDETCQVNYLVFGQLSDPMDDFYGAMGEAQLKVAVSGMVTPQGPGKATVEIDELGFYLRDAYDFNDGNRFLSQPLGFWGFNGVERHAQLRWDVEIAPRTVDKHPSEVRGYKYEVQNDDFREWRRNNHRGGDFIVLSDVLRVQLPFPQKISW